MAHMQPDSLGQGNARPPGPSTQAAFPTDGKAAGQARTYVRELLAKEDPPLGDDTRDDVLLVVSELVTNAYRYGTEPGDSLLVAVRTTPTCVRVEVHDPRRRHPRLRTASGERARGRGLHIVAALATRWGVEDRPFGKAVWAEVDR
ncbi:ATP-binding protein [Streptomyces sp. NPDC093252]|uniref:ATP-binding protein n=1 Tax=Streptomyces sp. NPDC093252 TaxID=3154980 RepID=UPI00341269AB